MLFNIHQRSLRPTTMTLMIPLPVWRKIKSQIRRRRRRRTKMTTRKTWKEAMMMDPEMDLDRSRWRGRRSNR